jgi:hypothetical protein
MSLICVSVSIMIEMNKIIVFDFTVILEQSDLIKKNMSIIEITKLCHSANMYI